MRDESIDRALSRLGNDPQLWQSLTDLGAAIDGVKRCAGDPCRLCGGVSRKFEIGTVPLLSERLSAVLRELEARDHQAAGPRPGTRATVWKRCRPDLRPDVRQRKSQKGLEGGAT